MASVGVLPDSPAVDIALIMVATAFIWVGSGWLETSAEHLSTHYGLPAVVQGSIVVAVGSSFPELASVVFAALSGVFEMGVGAIVGSAIFNVLVVPAIAGLATDEPVDANRTLVYKEAQFYMIAVSVLIITFALAVIYYPIGDGSALRGEVTRTLAVVPILLYGLYLFIQWQDVSEFDGGDVTGEIDVPRQWATLAAGLLVILISVEQLVGAVDSLRLGLGISEFLAGVTIIAAATSLPDTLVSVRAARSGKGLTSLGNVLGSNTFDLLIAIPVGVLIAGSAPVSFAVAAPMMGVLTLATILLFTVLRTGLTLTRVESYALLLAYAMFVVWIVAETTGVTSVIRG